jgi:hypothetical protein
VVVFEIAGVGNGEPVAIFDPPDGAAYHLIKPSEATAPNVTDPLPHLFPGVVAVINGLFTLTVSDTELRQIAPALFMILAL